VGSIENRLGRWRASRKNLAVNDEFYANKDLNPDRKIYTLSKGGFPFDLYYAKRLAPGTHSDRLEEELRQLGILTTATPSSDGTIPLSNVPPGTYASRLYGSVEQIKGRVLEEITHSSFQLNQDITIYLMHRDDADFVKFREIEREQTPVRNIMEALSSPLISSQYWMVGWSNWRTDRVNTSVDLAEKNPAFSQPAFNSPYFSLFEMSSRSIHAGGIQVTHREMMDLNFQKGIRISPYSPLGGFSILDQPEPSWENAKKAAKEKYDAGDAYWQNVFHAIFTDANEARWNRVVMFTSDFNAKRGTHYTIDQMINAYALSHPRTDFLTVGPITVEQLRRTVASIELARMLTPKDLEYLYSGQ
jgi:aryl-alcohol dehydrogenase-like predicted oxidoreductase